MNMPTDVLRDEHVLILRALDVLETATVRAGEGVELDDAWWSSLIAWLRGFADRNHHAKEETLLFPALERRGVPVEGGPIGVMLAEHVEGRALIASMDASRGDARLEYARRYIALLRAHIEKENNVLFELADAVLDAAAQQTLRRDFDAVAAELGRVASQPDAAAEIEALASLLGARAAPAARR